jgi:uncharacterized repeat protein (TIGR01451 family)
MNNKRTIFLIVATVLTVVLAVVAVLTSLKLQEQGAVPVTPNVPVSQPKAEEEILDIQQLSTAPICETTFTVTEDVVETLKCDSDCTVGGAPCPDGLACLNGKCRKEACEQKEDCICADGLACVAKTAYKASVSEANKLAELASVSRGDTLVYEIVYKNTGDSANSVTIKDVIPEGVEYVSNDKGCTYAAATQTLTCDDAAVASNVEEKVLVTVKVSADAVANAEIDNFAELTSGTGQISSCSASVKVIVGATPTPTPTPGPTPPPPTCNSYCANDGECPSGLTCSWNKCRNPECTDDNDCKCEQPPGCNEVCNPTNPENECDGGYVCDSATNTCRNSACMTETDCTCEIVPQISGQQDAPTQLPTAGSPIPMFIFLAAGALLVILGVLVVGM